MAATDLKGKLHVIPSLQYRHTQLVVRYKRIYKYKVVTNQVVVLNALMLPPQCTCIPLVRDYLSLVPRRE